MADPVTSIRYPVTVDAGLGRLAVEPDHARHVEQMIRQVLLTGPGERINRPDFGCGLRRMVFAPNNPASASLAQVAVFQALETWLGSVLRTEDVQVEIRAETLAVRVAYSLRARPGKRYLNLEVAL